MEGKLEGQQALFCFWIAPPCSLSEWCVCVLFGTLPRVLARAIILDPAALSCDAILWILDTRRVFFADALLAILVYFDTPPLCWDTCTSTHFCRTLSGKVFDENTRFSLHHCLLLYSSRHGNHVLLLSLCVLSSEQGRVDQFTRLASVTQLSSFLCIFAVLSFLFPEISEETSHTSSVCHLDLFCDRHCSLILIARQTHEGSSLSQITRQIELFRVINQAFSARPGRLEQLLRQKKKS